MEKDTECKLLETAVELFARKGFASVSIREISQAAQVNSALISYHFGGKEGLYRAVLEEQFLPIAGLMENVKCTPLPPPLERLKLYGRNVAVIHRLRPHLASFMHMELASPTECGGSIVRKHLSQVYDFLQTAFTEGIAAGVFRRDLNVSYATLSLAGIMNFFYLTRPIFKEFAAFSSEADMDYTAQAIEIFLNGIQEGRV